MDKIYIIGHKNPDTDSICSSIAYSTFKKLLGVKNCVPVRLGGINKETEFILNFFDIPIPQLIDSVKTQVSDIEYYKLNMIYPNATIKQIWEIVKLTQNKLLPIIESPEKRKMVGVVSVGDITKFNMEMFREASLSKYNISFLNISKVLNAEVLAGQNQLSDIAKGLIITYLNEESLSKLDINSIVLAGIGTDIDKIFKTKVKCIIITDDYKIQAVPEDFEGIVLSTKNSLFNTIRDIGLAVPVKEIMKTEDIIYFNETDFIDDIRDIMIKWRYRNFPVFDVNNDIVGTLSRRHLLDVKNKKVILVDHNEKAHSVDGLEQAHILEIIDHHRVGDIQTNYPIYFRNEAVGCTATIIGNMYFDNDLIPDEKTAGLLLSAIISDTLLFKSPTCTLKDITIAEKLSAITGLDIEEYGRKMLKAGTHLEDKTPEEILYNDFKEFTFNKYHLGIGQINTVSMDNIEQLKKDVLSYIKQVSKDKGYNITALIVTDIIDGGSEILYAGDTINVIKELFNSDSEESTGYLSGVISRKKQVIPQLMNKLAYY